MKRKIVKGDQHMYSLLLAALIGQSITVPTAPTAPNDWAQCVVEGIPTEKAEVHFFPQKGVSVIAAKTWGKDGVNFVLFKAAEEGQYLVYIVYPSPRTQEKETTGHVSGIITVSKDDPPVPPVPPTPQPTKYQIMLFQNTNDSDNLSQETNAILSGLAFRDKLKELGHTLKGSYNISKSNNFAIGTEKGDCKTGTCQKTMQKTMITKNSLKPFIDYLGDTKLPAAVIWDGKDGTVARAFTITTEKAFLEQLK